MVLFGDGSQTRDFSFVTDTARGIILAGMADAAVGETINLGRGSEVTITRLAEEVAKAVGTKVLVEHTDSRPGDVLRLCADASKAHRLCGYRARVSLSDGLTMLKSWYVAQGVAPEQLLEHEIVRNWHSVHSSADV